MAEENGDSTKPLVGADGLPMMSEEDVDKSHSGMQKMAPVLLIVPRLIFLVVAFLIYNYGSKAAYDARIATITSLDLGYLFCGVWAFSLTVNWLNIFPMFPKSQIMPGNAGNLRANMLIYKVSTPDYVAKSPYVVMEDEGMVGEYNRANRSLHHMAENVAATLLNIGLAGYVFPFPMMILLVLFSLGRIWHQIGYSGKGYGGHGGGFGVALIASTTMEMLVFFVGLRSLGCLGFIDQFAPQ